MGEALRRQAAGARRWCSPSRTPARTSAPAAPGRSRSPTARGTSRASSASSPAASTTSPTTSSTTCWRARSASRAPAARAPRACRCSSCRSSTSTPRPANSGERNGVFATNVEHKMGLKVSNTCEMTFGEHGIPAKGWLLGDVHDGIRQMFLIIEYARMMVGTKAIATLSTGYLNALEYAKSRVQGADLAQNGDKAAPRVTITHHPDVRRSLMLQKSYAEGLRALVFYTASWQDKVAMAERGRRREAATGRRAGQRPAAAAGQGRRLGAGVRAARPRVAADLRRLRLPAGLPARAVRPRRQDRHPVRGHDRDPEPRPGLPQDREGQRPGAGDRGHRDPGVHRRARPATASSRRSGCALGKALGEVQAMLGTMMGWLGAAQGGEPRELYKVGPEHPPGAAGPRRRGRRLAAAAPGRGRAEALGGDDLSAADRPSTRARSRRPGSSPARCCRGSAPTGGSSRTPTCDMMDLPEEAF